MICCTLMELEMNLNSCARTLLNWIQLNLHIDLRNRFCWWTLWVFKYYNCARNGQFEAKGFINFSKSIINFITKPKLRTKPQNQNRWIVSFRELNTCSNVAWINLIVSSVSMFSLMILNEKNYFYYFKLEMHA